MNQDLTFSEAREQLAAVSMMLRKTDDGEYRVSFKGRSDDASAYFTGSLLDAIETGISMRAAATKQVPRYYVRRGRVCLDIIDRTNETLVEGGFFKKSEAVAACKTYNEININGNWSN